MSEATYTCPACKKQLGLAEARTLDFLCPADRTPLQRQKIGAEPLGLPALKVALAQRESGRARLEAGPAPVAPASSAPAAKPRADGEPAPAQPDPAQAFAHYAPAPDHRLDASADEAARLAVPRIARAIAAPSPSAPSPRPASEVASPHAGAPSRSPRGTPWHTGVLAGLTVALAIGQIYTLGRLRELAPLAARQSTLEHDRDQAVERDLALAGRLDGQVQRLDQAAAGLEAALTTEGFARRYADIVPDVVARCEPSIVHIMNQHFVVVNGQRQQRGGTGSGFFIEDRRLVVTNYHVIHAAETLKLQLFNNQTVDAVVHASDPVSDVAILRVDLTPVPHSEQITAARFDRRALRPGEPVFALGSPSGLARTVTRGIVSNTRRYHGRQPMPGAWIATGMFNNWIQTDAAINPGNSGGPMFDLAGAVVGVVTRKKSEVGIDNIGFALPADYVMEVIEQLKRGEVRRSTLGAFLVPHNPPMGTARSGARVLDVLPGSPADRAGLARDDVIVRVGGEAASAPYYEDLPEFERRLALLPVSEPIALEVERGGQLRRLSATPRVRTALDDKVQFYNQLGFYGAELTPEIAVELGIEAKQGLWLCAIQSGSVLDAQGFKKGDVLLTIAHPTLGPPQPLTTTEQAWTNIWGAIGKKLTPLTFTCQRGNQQLHIALNLNYGG